MRFNLSIPNELWVLAISNALLTISFVMVYSLSGIYLKEIVGMSEFWIAIVACGIEGISYALKLFSGMISDLFGKRKILILMGYCAICISRPMLAFFPTPLFAGLARLLERIGNSLQTPSAEAIVTDIAPKKVLGSFFGLKRSLGMLGACLGAGLGMLSVKYCSFSKIFLMASIPSILGLGLVFFGLKEKDSIKSQRFQIKNLGVFPLEFWVLIFLRFVYMLACGSEVFISLHAREYFSLDLIYIPLISLLYNALYAAISYPVGVLSDHYDTAVVLGGGFLVFACANILLVGANNLWGFWGAIILWGIQLGILQNLLISLLAKSLPPEFRGTGFGIFYLISAIALSIAGILSGFLVQYTGIFTLFSVSSCIALSGAIFCWRYKWARQSLA